MRSLSLSRSVAVAAAFTLVACGGDLPTSAGNSPVVAGDESLAASLDELSASASLLGDDRSAEAYADGALAIRLGAVPTEIAVAVGGQDFRYWAVITGIVERGPDGADAAALATLPPRTREVFLLSREHGLTYAGIAETLGISVKTVETLMGRAIRSLREALRP